MPVSEWRNIPAVLQAVFECRPGGQWSSEPMRILDVGAGFAKYGVLFRELADIGFERYDRESWTSTIDAVEIWPQWITPTHKHVYSNVFIEDYGDTVERRKGYDVVFIGDVIEHFDKDEGLRIVQQAMENNRHVVLSIPDSDDWRVAGSRTAGGFEHYLGNPYELHKARWYKSDFPSGTFFPVVDGSACFVVRVPK